MTSLFTLFALGCFDGKMRDTALGTDCEDGARYADDDGDGYGAGPVICEGVRDNNDCDDADPDDPTDGQIFYDDDDNDGYGDELDAGTVACELPVGMSADNTDCDDHAEYLNPGEDEICNELDDDCDGFFDEDDDDLADASAYWYRDSDGDGYGDPENLVVSCQLALAGYVQDGTDCDDDRPGSNPGETEVCNGLDDDCDGLFNDDDDSLDRSTGERFYTDADGDGYGDADNAFRSCELQEGYSESDADCDDADPEISPGAEEVCDEVDNDCDGRVDDDDTDTVVTEGTLLYPDADADGYGDADDPGTLFCGDSVSGYLADNTDCDDARPGSNPGETEVCNGLDDDCDGLMNDEDDSLDTSTGSSFYVDADGDGYGDPDNTVMACEVGDGRTTDATDCDDSDASFSPGATEVCDDEDNDCDGLVDDDDGDVDTSTGTTFYVDDDGDGYGDPDNTTMACDEGSGWVSDATDCDDERPGSNPGETEVCNGLDDDCDGLMNDEDDSLDTSTGSSFYVDADGDGYGDPDNTVMACEVGDGRTTDATDCDDSDATISPAAEEIWYDDVDQDCAGDDDLDADGDGYRYGLSDCDDADADVNPAEAEICDDGVDQDCVDDDTACRPEGALGTGDADELLGLSGYVLGYEVGAALATLDRDADGLPDVLVGAPDKDGGDGGGYLYWGDGVSLVDYAWSLDAAVSGADLGAALSAAGDIDGDGVDDFLLGAPEDGTNGSAAGCAYLVTTTTVSSSAVQVDSSHTWLLGEGSGDNAGWSVAGDGDLDGDGRDDIAIGAPYDDAADSDAGAVYVLWGPVTGTVDLSLADAKVRGGAENDAAGWSLDFAGDLDGDGSDELVVGAYGDDAGGASAGAVRVYEDPSGSLGTEDADATLTGEAGSWAGRFVRGGVDADADGYGDLLVGAPLSSAGGGAGALWVVLGPITGGDLADAEIGATSSTSGEWAGESAAIGDIDGDGEPDLAVGAPYNASSASSAGAGYLVYGPLSGIYDLAADADVIVSGDSESRLGTATLVLDVDGNAFADVLFGAPGGDAAYLYAGFGQ